MKIIVGTTNQRKIAAVQSVADSFLTVEAVSVSGCSAQSEVRDTPFDEETKTGAINRAKNSQQCEPLADICIGIESGLVVRYGEWFEEVWVAVLYQENIYTAYSSGMVLPASVSEALSADVQNHSQVMGELRASHNIDVHEQLGVDTWGNYTGNKVVREVGIEEAVRNALVQVFPGEKNFYTK